MKFTLEKRILAVFLLAFMIIGCIGSKAPLQIVPQLASVTAQIIPSSKEKNIDKEKKAEETENTKNSITSEIRSSEEKEEAVAQANEEDVAGNFSDSLFFKDQMVQQNGALSKQLGMAEVFNQDNAYVLDNGYVVGVYDYADTEYETAQVTAFRDFLAGQGISLLYVNEPVKYTDDAALSEQLGILTYSNDNADRLLANLEKAQVPVLDIRDVFAGTDSFSWFYRTDHHWTTSAGKEAARAISQKMNDEFGYGIDLSLYDDENLIYTVYEDSWLGEQGRKLGESYVGMEDYVLILPAYETLFTLQTSDDEQTGPFEEVLINQEIMLEQNNQDIYSAPSWHYIYRGNEGKITNDLNENGKNVLVLGDSYDTVTNAFLALGARSVEGIVLRDYQGDIRQYILDHDFDTVVIAYTQFMIGAHNDEDSSNYRMYDF